MEKLVGILRGQRWADHERYTLLYRASVGKADKVKCFGANGSCFWCKSLVVQKASVAKVLWYKSFG